MMCVPFDFIEVGSQCSAEVVLPQHALAGEGHVPDAFEARLLRNVSRRTFTRLESEMDRLVLEELPTLMA